LGIPFYTITYFGVSLFRYVIDLSQKAENQVIIILLTTNNTEIQLRISVEMGRRDRICKK